MLQKRQSTSCHIPCFCDPYGWMLLSHPSLLKPGKGISFPSILIDSNVLKGTFMTSPHNLTLRESLTLLGGVFLFVAFFMAMYAAGTAEMTPAQVCHSLVESLNLFSSKSKTP